MNYLIFWDIIIKGYYIKKTSLYICTHVRYTDYFHLLVIFFLRSVHPQRNHYHYHNEIESYICFDDAELKGWDNNIFNEKNFIRCDKSIGITKEQADHAIELLNIIR